MALLNKLFFPSSATSATSPAFSTQSSASASTWASAVAGAATGSSTTIKANSTSSTANRRQNHNHSVNSRNYLSQFPFDGRQIRILLYRECDSRGRRLLFDSNALQKVHLHETNGNIANKSEKIFRGKDSGSALILNQKQQHQQSQLRKEPGHSNDFIEVCQEYGYKHQRPNSTDIMSIGEMVFGASAMSFRGTALKMHWLQAPARIFLSQLFLTPLPNGSHSGTPSPYSTISAHSLATPRTSICSEHGSIDGYSMSSVSMPFSANSSRQLSITPSENSSIVTSPLDVPTDQQSSAQSSAHSAKSIASDSGSGMHTNTTGGPRYSSTCSNSTAFDSGYSRSGGGGTMSSSDQWSAASYQYSTRSSLGSVLSEQSDALRKLSLDSSGFATCSSDSPLLEGIAASDGSLQRRIYRNLCTSFENEHSVNDFIGFVNDTYVGGYGGVSNGGSEGGYLGLPNYRRASYCANETRSNPEIGGRRRDAGMGRHKRPKLGLAICITLSESFEEEMELFCSEHVALLESMLSRVRICVERAYINHKDFLRIVYDAWQETQQWFNDLFTAPRIQCPVWLSITTSGSKYSKNVAERFLKELCWLLSFADTKDTNFFVSTMLTAILTHHLGWVTTVTAFHCSSSRSEAATAAIDQRAKLLQISQKHPYNALWAQLSDLFGALGMPPKLARTIVYGTERLQVERLLSVLTYFIRCGEVRRASKREDFSKEIIDRLVAQNHNEKIHRVSTSNVYGVKARKNSNVNYGMASNVGSTGGGGITRTPTCKQHLNTITGNCKQVNYEDDSSSSSGHSYVEGEVDPSLLRNSKRNEIPNVLAFRDSRFVQQELRIGNYLMDTGIEKNSLVQLQPQKQPLRSAQCKTNDGSIRLTVTTPDNVELNVEYESVTSGSVSLDDGAVEAIEIDATATSAILTGGGNAFFWHKIVPQTTVKEGLSLAEMQRHDSAVNVTESAASLGPKRHSQLSLSDLITQNSMGKGERMTWGIEPIKEAISPEEQFHFDSSQRQIEREHGLTVQQTTAADASSAAVVFVLGDNEPLINLRRSTEDFSAEEMLASADNKNFPLCALHRRTCVLAMEPNTEEQGSVYVKSKSQQGVPLSNYDMLMDKCAQLEEKQEKSMSADGVKCMICLRMSPASEIEFGSDEGQTGTLHPNNSATSVETLKSATIITSRMEGRFEVTPTETSTTRPATATLTPTAAKRCGTYSTNSKKYSSHRGSISSVAAKCAAANGSNMQLLKLPLPGTKELQEDDTTTGEMKLRTGFAPSLFLNVSDHYIPDMVLQGICAAPRSWETKRLRDDLTLAARSATLLSQPAENIAIVADMEKWDVRLISSQTSNYGYGISGGQTAPVGMSQLVSNMLETVQAMHVSGISAYECLSFLESKLQEIYLQSETLAAFLLETDFCSLNTVAKALNLAENDVPLLLSIASIHTPQISKKCGISTR